MEYEGWAIVELMGRRTFGGRVSEVDMYGGKLLRLDVFGKEGEEPELTQYYGSAAIYCITPAAEETAREVGSRSLPRTLPAAPIQLPFSEGPEIDIFYD